MTLALALAGLMLLQAEPDVTVTARKLPTRPIRDAIGYFERHCFDASRLTGSPSTPRADPDWHVLTAAERTTFGLAGKPDRAFGMMKPDGQALVLAYPEPVSAKGLLEQRCTLIVSGGDHSRFNNRMAAIFKGGGTQKHVGDWIPRTPGWQQLLWAAIPSIGSKDWHVFRTREAGDTWVRVIDPVFYRQAEYVVADLRIRTAGQPLTVATLIYTHRERPDR